MKISRGMLHLNLIWGVVLVSLLNGCGGGGGGAPGGGSSPPPPPPSGGGSAASTYLFYSGSLSAVDPASPASPITVEAGSDIATGLFGISPVIATFQSGTYNGATQTVTNIHPHALIYAKTDGKFYKVSALKSGSLAPAQVSSESVADQLCINAMQGTANFTDYANMDNSQYVYALPGADGDCETGDDVWQMVRLGMSAAAAPVAAKPPVMVLGDATTGAISGWLVHDAGALKKCDANFAACATVKPVASEVAVRFGLGLNRHLLNIDDQLFVYDGNANTLSASLFSIPATTSVGASAADDNQLYFAHEKTIYKVPADGSALATVLAVEADDIGFQMAVTANKVVYTTRAQLSAGALIKAAHLKVVDKVSGGTTTLATAGTADEAFFFVNGNNIYYSLTDYIASAAGMRIVPIVAGVIDDAGGGKSETVNATWFGGAIYPTSVDLSKSASLAYQPEKLVRIEGYDALGSGKDFAGGTLKTFYAATGAAGAMLGTLPTTENFRSVTCFGSGDNALCSAMTTLTPPPALPALPIQTDVFFINTATANSLTRVTNTADKNEAPVY